MTPPLLCACVVDTDATLDVVVIVLATNVHAGGGGGGERQTGDWRLIMDSLVGAKLLLLLLRGGGEGVDGTVLLCRTQLIELSLDVSALAPRSVDSTLLASPIEASSFFSEFLWALCRVNGTGDDTLAELARAALCKRERDMTGVAV